MAFVVAGMVVADSRGQWLSHLAVQGKQAFEHTLAQQGLRGDKTGQFRGEKESWRVPFEGMRAVREGVLRSV